MAAEHSSYLRCKIGASVSPREWYPELPDLSDHTLPYTTCRSMVLVLWASHVLTVALPTTSNMCTIYECHNNVQLIPFYAVSSSLMLVWPLLVRIPESLPNKVVNCLVYVLFLRKCDLYYCHRVSTQLQLTNISIKQSTVGQCNVSKLQTSRFAALTVTALANCSCLRNTKPGKFSVMFWANTVNGHVVDREIKAVDREIKALHSVRTTIFVYDVWVTV